MNSEGDIGLKRESVIVQKKRRMVCGDMAEEKKERKRGRDSSKKTIREI